MMRKLSKKDMEELREFLGRGCDYAGTQEVVNDLVTETLKEIGTEYPYGDEISLFDGDDQFSTVDELANIFWDKAIEEILNVVETKGE